MQSVECRSKLPYEYIVTANEKTVKVSNASLHVLSNCNHEEADTRLFLHAIRSEKDCVIVASDTDVLILLVWAYGHYQVKKNWYFQYETHCFVNVSMVCDYLGKDVCSRLPAFHALTGCDQTSYFSGAGKSRIFEKALDHHGSFKLLDALTSKSILTKETSKDIQKFVRTIVYSGKEDESYVGTRTRMYKNMKNKSSVGLPPDPDSLLQHIRRVQLQTVIWCSSGETMIESLNPEEYGWMVDETNENIEPLWFSGPQLPPSLNRRKKNTKKIILTNSVAVTEADAECSDVPSRNVRKRVIRKTKNMSKPDVAAKKTKTTPKNTPGTSGSKFQVAVDVIVSEDILADDEQEKTNEENSYESDWEVSDFESSYDSDSDW